MRLNKRSDVIWGETFLEKTCKEGDEQGKYCRVYIF